MAGTLFLYPEDSRLGAFQIVASIKVPQRFNVERSIALGNTNVAPHRFVAG